MKIKALINPYKFAFKPNEKQVWIIQKSWNQALESGDIFVVKEALEKGQTIKFNKYQLNTIIIDADKVALNLAAALETLKIHSLLPSIAYETFSSTSALNCFRLIYFVDTNNLNKVAYVNFTKQLELILNIELDYAFANNVKQICYGTNHPVFIFNQSNITLDHTPYSVSNDIRYAANVTVKSKTLLFLEGISYSLFLKELQTILKNKEHIGYEVTLRWYLSNFSNPKLQAQILVLSSSDTQHKIKAIETKNGYQYLLRLVSKNSNFYRLFYSNLKRKKK